MDKSLLTFHQNTDLKDNVHAYLIKYLEKVAIEKVFNKEDVSAIADAKEVIDRAFENLDILFAPKNKKREFVNEAR
jgi:uncharacterized protein YdeI (YjbR/CyaY-like superfamily)